MFAPGWKVHHLPSLRVSQILFTRVCQGPEVLPAVGRYMIDLRHDYERRHDRTLISATRLLYVNLSPVCAIGRPNHSPISLTLRPYIPAGSLDPLLET